MGRVSKTRTVAKAFIGSMTANDIVDVMFFNDRQVVSDSKWQPASAKGQVDGFVNALKSTYPAQGRVRPLFNIIKQGATDGFRELGNVGTKVSVPLHQAMVVLSNGTAGADAQSNGPGASLLSQYLAKGRFPEDNTVQPKTPLPVISVWLPSGGFDEFRANAQEFMQGLANPDIGGFYDVIRAGQAQGTEARDHDAHALQPDAHHPMAGYHQSVDHAELQARLHQHDRAHRRRFDVQRRPLGIDPRRGRSTSTSTTRAERRPEPDRARRQVHGPRRFPRGRRKGRRGVLHLRSAASARWGTDIEREANAPADREWGAVSRAVFGPRRRVQAPDRNSRDRVAPSLGSSSTTTGPKRAAASGPRRS
jgi:hypothetical protein